MKRYVSLLLAFVIIISAAPTSYAFTDIEDQVISAAAEGLMSVGILSDVPSFNPNNALSRAEFCKMAVLSAGFNEESLYSSYTLFPDVLSGNWSTPYVNAAVRKYSIVKAYPTGNFGPADNIPYGQAVTILLRMLGYKDEEIGTFWPNDFVIKADQIGLTKGITGLGAYDAIPRAQAAVLLNNMLFMKKSDGTSFVSTAFTATPDSILLDTSETNLSLKSGYIAVWDGKERVEYATKNKIPASLVGLRGTLVFEKQNPQNLIGFLADTSNIEFLTVKSTTLDYIETTTGKTAIPQTAKVSIFDDIFDYSKSWFDIKPQSKIAIYRDSRGIPTFISVIGSSLSGQSYVYGVDNFTPQAGVKVIKNGAVANATALKKYDVVSYSKFDNTYYVSDDTLTLLYENATPTYANPTSITAGGLTFSVTDGAGKYFKDMSFGAPVTLLLNSMGTVSGAFSGFPGGASQPRGILKSLSDTQCEVLMDSGHTLKYTPDLTGWQKEYFGETYVTSLYRLLGQYVYVKQDKEGKLQISSMPYSKSDIPDVKTSLSMTADYMSSAVKVYEQIDAEMPLLLLDNKTLKNIPKAQIKHIETDGAGKVNLLITGDITGDNYTYGLLRQSVEEKVVGSGIDSPIYRTVYTVSIKTADGLKSFDTYYNPHLSTSYTEGGIATALLGTGYYASAPSKSLKSLGSVARTSFESTKRVTVGGTTVELPENVPVYLEKYNKFISLEDARTNYTNFELYSDAPLNEGGRIRLIKAF